MPIELIGKSILGDLGFCQVPSKMGDHFEDQMKKISDCIFTNKHIHKIAMTSMTGSKEVSLTNGLYIPKIRLYDKELYSMFNPYEIYQNCVDGLDTLRPGADFIVWDYTVDYSLCVTTFSREAPILAFESCTGQKALGVILRPSLMKYGDYLFSTIKTYLKGYVTVTLVTCNHFEYEEGSIPSIISELAKKYGMECDIPKISNSEKNPECYHRGEKGNHVVAMW